MPSDQEPAIRLATREELHEAGTIVALSFESFRAALPPHILEPYMADASDLAAVWDEANVVVMERERRIVGTVTYYEDAGREGMGWPPGFAGLRTLAVSPPAQGHGFGRKLCEWCIARAREQGAEALGLHTAEFMVSACRLYESLGFQRRPSHDLLASNVLGLDPMLGDQRIIAYSLLMGSAPKTEEHPGGCAEPVLRGICGGA
jgi:ribosomal protein S18 acetylase RimI-like enzyme